MESSKFKLKKTKLIQITLLLLAFLLIFFTYFFTLKKKQTSTTTNLDQIKTVEPDGEKEKAVNTNTFISVQYTGLDSSGNRFLIDSKEAYFETARPDIILMNGISCTFYFKDQTIMTVQSSYGIYNNVTDDMEFTENVKMNYLENVLFSEKANFFNVKKELTIEGDVKTKGPEGQLNADKLEFDLNSKKLKISMANYEKVNIKVNY